MWLVDPADMCPQHRAGEHKEIHDLLGFIRGGHISKVIFHAARGQVFPGLIGERHATLEAHHGWDSPVSVPDVADDLTMAEPTAAVRRHNRRELARRCADCRRRMGEVVGL
jgi:hypothetical protein